MRVNRSVLSFMAILTLAAALVAAPQGNQVRLTKIKVTAEQANLREKPDIGSSIVQQIPEGAILEAESKEGEWFFVRYTLEDGGVIGGYIHESLVEVVATGEPVPQIKPRGQEAPSGERATRRVRIGRIKLPDLSTGPFPLEFSVSAGLGSIAPRDLNDGIQGFADWTGAELGIPAPGSADVLHGVLLMGFELSYRVSPRLAVGLGADVLHGANKGEIEYSDELVTETLVTKPVASAVPLKVTARFYPGQGFYVRGGICLFSVKAGYLYRLEGEDGWEQSKGKATGTGLGGEAAFGGEWEIAPQTTVFAEAGFRMASFRKLTGRNVTTNSAGESVTEPGTLYYSRKVAADAETYPLLFVSEVPPADAVDSRRAGLNLSGAAIRAGVRYRF
jgi:hypothetical protein